MYHAVIIYASGENKLKSIVGKIEESFDKDKFEVVVKDAADASIPDIAAADLILLGSSQEGSKAVHSNFAEIIRAFEGISLAGRVAGLFSVDSERTLSKFKKALKDSEVTLKKENSFLVNSSERINKTQIREWLQTLSAQVEEIIHAR